MPGGISHIYQIIYDKKVLNSFTGKKGVNYIVPEQWWNVECFQICGIGYACEEVLILWGKKYLVLCTVRPWQIFGFFRRQD